MKAAGIALLPALVLALLLALPPPAGAQILGMTDPAASDLPLEIAATVSKQAAKLMTA